MKTQGVARFNFRFTCDMITESGNILNESPIIHDIIARIAEEDFHEVNPLVIGIADHDDDFTDHVIIAVSIVDWARVSQAELKQRPLQLGTTYTLGKPVAKGGLKGLVDP